MTTTEAPAVTITLPGKFCDWLNGTGLALGHDDIDPECKATRLAYDDGTLRRTSKGYYVKVTTSDDAVLRLLHEYGTYCEDAIVNGDPDPVELRAARTVMERAKAARKELKERAQAVKEQQEAQAEQDAADMVTELRYERRTGGDGTAEFSSSTELLFWVRREVASALRHGRKVTKNTDGLIKIEGGTERTVRLLPLPDETEVPTPSAPAAAAEATERPVVANVDWTHREGARKTGLITFTGLDAATEQRLQAQGREPQFLLTGGTRRKTVDLWNDYNAADQFAADPGTVTHVVAQAAEWLCLDPAALTIREDDETR